MSFIIFQCLSNKVLYYSLIFQFDTKGDPKICLSYVNQCYSNFVYFNITNSCAENKNKFFKDIFNSTGFY